MLLAASTILLLGLRNPKHRVNNLELRGGDGGYSVPKKLSEVNLNSWASMNPKIKLVVRLACSFCGVLLVRFAQSSCASGQNIYCDEWQPCWCETTSKNSARN